MKPGNIKTRTLVYTALIEMQKHICGLEMTPISYIRFIHNLSQIRCCSRMKKLQLNSAFILKVKCDFPFLNRSITSSSLQTHCTAKCIAGPGCIQYMHCCLCLSVLYFILFCAKQFINDSKLQWKLTLQNSNTFTVTASHSAS